MYRLSPGYVVLDALFTAFIGVIIDAFTGGWNVASACEINTTLYGATPAVAPQAFPTQGIIVVPNVQSSDPAQGVVVVPQEQVPVAQ